jgi:hypothetical protein
MSSSPSTPFTVPCNPTMEYCCPSTPRPLKRTMILSVDTEDIYVPTSHGHDTVHIVDLPPLPFPAVIDGNNTMSELKLARTSSQSLPFTLNPRKECSRPGGSQRCENGQKTFPARCA